MNDDLTLTKSPRASASGPLLRRFHCREVPVDAPKPDPLLLIAADRGIGINPAIGPTPRFG